MKPITVKQLHALCAKEIKNGHGDMSIMISDDDEGNGYHYLWYSFQTVKDYEKPEIYNGKEFKMDFYYADERVDSKDNTIILG